MKKNIYLAVSFIDCIEHCIQRISTTTIQKLLSSQMVILN
jgi:hypothetical protein